MRKIEDCAKSAFRFQIGNLVPMEDLLCQGLGICMTYGGNDYTGHLSHEETICPREPVKPNCIWSNTLRAASKQRLIRLENTNVMSLCERVIH